MRLNTCRKEHKTYFIAEMSANHANDLSVALKIVEAAKEAGADCIKTQLYSADTLTIDCDKSCFQISSGLWNGYTLYELYGQACMPWEWQAEIQKKCVEVGLDFLATAFDQSSVDYLVELGVDAIKIASFELVDIPLVTYAAKQGKTMILSCGMCTKDEIQDALDACLAVGNDDVILMKCSSEYPANIEHLHLNTIPDMIRSFGVPVGFSDHSLGSLAPIVATNLGACTIEKHFCLNKEIKTADCSFSMTPSEFSAMVADVKRAESAKGYAFYGVSESEKESIIFRRSLFAVKDIDIGESFTEENVRSIRPGTGLSPKFYYQLIGKKSIRRIERGDPILASDLSGDDV